MAARPVADFRKLALIVMILVLAHNEWFTYLRAFRRWPDRAPSDWTSVLWVADPQLQGRRDEPGGLGGMLTR